MSLSKTAKQYTSVDPEQKFNAPRDVYDRAANWALAGLEENRAYRLTAKDQKRILGFVVGKGRILCDWDSRTVYNVTQCCFGTDSTYQNSFCLCSGNKNY
jgi:hypothetical protein